MPIETMVKALTALEDGTGYQMDWLPYTGWHLRHERCLQLARELRQTGEYRAVRIGSTVTDWDDLRQQYSKYNKVFVSH